MCDLKGWTVYNLEDKAEYYDSMEYLPLGAFTPGNDGRLPRGVYRGTFNVDRPGDTFLDFSTWGKGLVYVNGHPLGRIWEIGPQQTLYMPGCWLRKGENEIMVYDILGPREARSRGLREPIIDSLNLPAIPVHRKDGETLDLTGETPALTAACAPGNGWQQFTFDVPATGRYVCIEALSPIGKGTEAAIAELYLLDKDGKRLSREPWTVRYADSEEVTHGNHAADKIFDLQESTYWTTPRGIPYPHAVVIDLGAEHTLGGIQMLPRMESTVPGAIKDFKVYVKPGDFRY